MSEFRTATPRGRRRRIGLTVVAVIAAIGLAVAVLPDLQSSADALPICPQPPCGVTTTTVHQTPTWNVNLLHLQQDVGGTGTITADRSWLSNPVICCVDTVPPIATGPRRPRPRARPWRRRRRLRTWRRPRTAAKAADAATSPIFVGTLTPAGSSGLSGGQFKFPTDPLPSGAAHVPAGEGVRRAGFAVPHHAGVAVAGVRRAAAHPDAGAGVDVRGATFRNGQRVQRSAEPARRQARPSTSSRPAWPRRRKG